MAVKEAGARHLVREELHEWARVQVDTRFGLSEPLNDIRGANDPSQAKPGANVFENVLR